MFTQVKMMLSFEILYLLMTYNNSTVDKQRTCQVALRGIMGIYDYINHLKLCQYDNAQHFAFVY